MQPFNHYLHNLIQNIMRFSKFAIVIHYMCKYTSMIQNQLGMYIYIQNMYNLHRKHATQLCIYLHVYINADFRTP